MKRLLAVLVLLALCAPAFAAEVELAWDAAPNPLWGTRIYIGTAAGSYTASYDAGAGSVIATVKNLEPGKTYYFAARHYFSGAQSGLSNEVSAAIPLPDEYDIFPELPPVADEVERDAVRTYQITIRRVGE